MGIDMKRQRFTCVAALFSLQANAQDGLGVVELKQNGSHVFSTQKLVPKQIISVITADGMVRCCYRVGKPDRQENDRVLDESPANATVVAYRLTPSSRTARVDLPLLGIGFPAKPTPSITSKSTDETTFRQGGTAYQLKQCTTTEGLRLTLQRGGDAVRQYYLSLGYDVTPTCKP